MKDIAQLLVEHDIVKTNFTTPFTWTSGIKSPIYCDCRELTGLIRARTEIVDQMINQVRTLGISVDAVAGTATAGISWAAWVADRLDKPMCYVRSKPKGHGAGKMVEGRIPKPSPDSGESRLNILVVEDAFSTGGSSIASAEALRAELGADVTHILGIFSWSTPEFFTRQKHANLEMIPLTNFEEITAALLEAGKISETEKADLETFHRNPRTWYK